MVIHSGTSGPSVVGTGRCCGDAQAAAGPSRHVVEELHRGDEEISFADFDDADDADGEAAAELLSEVRGDAAAGSDQLQP